MNLFYCEDKEACDQSPLCPKCGVGTLRREDFFSKKIKRGTPSKPGKGTKEASEKMKEVIM